MNVFQLATNDQSVFYLSHIFGAVGNLFSVATVGGSDPLPVLPSLIFSNLNTMALVLGTLLVVYVTIIGVLATAHEGEFMGKKWSGLWVPIRMVLGIVGLFPTQTGYCAIQLIIMWIILQGVGAADKLWGVVLSYINIAGSPYQGISIGTDSGNISKISIQSQMGILFQALVCQESAKRKSTEAYGITTDNRSGNPYYYCSTQSSPNTNEFCGSSSSDMYNIVPAGASQSSYNAASVSSDGATIDYKIGPNGACGTLTYNNSTPFCTAANDSSKSADDQATNALACAGAKGQQAAFTTILAVLGPLAKQFVDADHEYMTFYKTTPTGRSNPNPLILPTINNNLSAVPTWIQAYCTSKSIPLNQCCSNFSDQTKSPSQNVPCEPAFFWYSAVNDETNINPYVVTDYFPLYAINNIALLTKKNDFVGVSINQYITGITSAMTTAIMNASTNQPINGRLATALDQGWITAGANYYAMTSAGGHRLQDAVDKLSFTITAPDPRTAAEGTSAYSLKSYRTNFQAAGLFVGGSQKNDQSGAGQVTPQFGSITSNTQSSLLATFQTCIKGGAGTGTFKTNVMKDIATFGYALMILAQVLYATILTIIVLITALTDINFIALGFGLTSNPAGEAFRISLFFLGPIFFALITSLYSLGALLGIYIPLVPYIIFTVSAIGWLIATIEAMVAGPIIALGILSPTGQHEILGKAEHSVNMLLNLFLRPSLMITGLMLAIFLSDVVLNMINAGFLPITEDIIQAPGLFEEILFIAAYTSLITIAVNKCFALIFEIPNKITTWIGGQPVSHGEGEALGQIQSGVSGAAQASGGAMKGGGESGKAAEDSGRKQKDKKDADDLKKAQAAQDNVRLNGGGGN